jgi:hypothetical protein
MLIRPDWICEVLSPLDRAFRSRRASAGRSHCRSPTSAPLSAFRRAARTPDLSVIGPPLVPPSGGQPPVRGRESVPRTVQEWRPVPDDDAVEGQGEDLVDAATSGAAIGEGCPADQTAHSDAIVEPHRARVAGGPAVAQAADVVDEVGEHQGARRSVEERALFEAEAVDAQLVDDAGESAVGRGGVAAIDAQVATLPRQLRRGVQARRREGRFPVADPEVVEGIRRERCATGPISSTAASSSGVSATGECSNRPPSPRRSTVIVDTS